MVLFTVSSFAQTQLGADIDGEVDGDQFGGSVSMSSDGTIMATGGIFNSRNGFQAGHVRIYKYNLGT